MRSVSVVIPYYDQPEQLLRTWEGLQRQGVPDLQVVIADDGSTRRPPRLDGEVVHVRQADLGFRAGAARNLGAAAADGEVLAFLDADTIPEPGYLTALLPATTAEVITVGRRRHADLAAWTPQRTGCWLDGGPGPAELTEPAWLIDGYRETDDLRQADGRSFRFVISAVMALRAELFHRLGGFAERYVGYGGEDWDLAYRAWNTGADLRHVRDAVAWHDGPDWAARPHGSKEAEESRLAELIPEPSIRRGRTGGVADVLVNEPLDQRARFQITVDRALPPEVVTELVSRLADRPRLRLLHRGSEIGEAVTNREQHRREQPAVDLEIGAW